MISKRSQILAVAIGSLVALAVTGAVRPAAAQDTYHYGTQWELTGFGGYLIAQDIYTVTSGGGDGSTIGFENSTMYGGRIGVFPTRYGGVEFQYMKSGSDITTRTSYPGYTPGGDLGRIDYDSYDINFVARQQNLANPRVTGFGTIGFGWTQTHPKLNGPVTVGSNSLFGINFGLGAKVNMSPALSLVLQGRWKITQTNLTTGSYNYCDYWGYCYGYTSNAYDSGELTAGLTYNLRGRK
jgi:hypothetical protein